MGHWWCGDDNRIGPFEKTQNSSIEFLYHWYLVSSDVITRQVGLKSWCLPILAKSSKLEFYVSTGIYSKWTDYPILSFVWFSSLA